MLIIILLQRTFFVRIHREIVEKPFCLVLYLFRGEKMNTLFNLIEVIVTIKLMNDTGARGIVRNQGTGNESLKIEISCLGYTGADP